MLSSKFYMIVISVFEILLDIIYGNIYAVF